MVFEMTYTMSNWSLYMFGFKSKFEIIVLFPVRIAEIMSPSWPVAMLGRFGWIGFLSFCSSPLSLIGRIVKSILYY